MKVEMKGHVGKQQILETVAQLLNALEHAGVDDFTDVTLYCSPCVAGKRVVPKVDGSPLSIVKKSKNKHIKIEQNPDDPSKELVTYDKGIKAKDMNINGRLNFKTPIQLPNNGQQYRDEKKKREACFQVKAKTDEVSQGCAAEALLMKALNLTFDEFLAAKSSSGWIRTRKGIERYTHDKIHHKVFRVSMKVKGSAEKDVYLFSPEGELVFEGKSTVTKNNTLKQEIKNEE